MSIVYKFTVHNNYYKTLIISPKISFPDSWNEKKNLKVRKNKKFGQIGSDEIILGGQNPVYQRWRGLLKYRLLHCMGIQWVTSHSLWPGHLL